MTILKIYRLLTIVCLGILFTGCQDTFEYSVTDIPEGESRVHITVSYDQFIPALETRSHGQSIESINSLWILLYDTKSIDGEGRQDLPGELVKKTKVYDAATGLGTGVNISSTGVNSEISLTEVLPNGQYRIYAVANMDLEDEDVSTVEKLRTFETRWITKIADEADPTKLVTDHVKKNAEMFGWFVNGDNSTSRAGEWNSTAPIVRIDHQNTRIHSYLYRCASKVTLAYDGSGLKEGVSIYLLGVSIKDIPNRCALGVENIAADESALISDGEKIVYAKDVAHDAWAAESFFTDYEVKLENTSDGRYKFYPQKNSGEERETWKKRVHSPDAEALFFYENMQGDGGQKGNVDSDNNGVPDDKDNKPFGTYIEVEAIYRQINTDNGNPVPESGIIKYRFMLGEDIKNNYDACRNRHYQLTLKFTGSPKDHTWTIDYNDNVLTMTDPQEVDYRGKVFAPNEEYPNLGHAFDDETVIRVVSYVKGEQDKLVPYTITFEGDGVTDPTQAPSWLGMQESRQGDYPYEEDLVFKVQAAVPQSFNVEDKLQVVAKGSETMPVNLADKNRNTVIPSAAKAFDTANCYVIDGPGWYLLPAVYGNAIKNGADNKEAYRPGGSGLNIFKNHLGKEITQPYITGDINPKGAAVIWQDENNLIDDDFTWIDSDKVRYLPEAYDGKGGILFRVTDKGQGNAVIGLLDKSSYGNKPIVTNEIDIIWSWHIWVTSIMTTDILKDDRTIRITTAENGDFNVLPVNLGWCSNEGDPPVKYYPGRKCKIILNKGEENEVSKTIYQKSHISVPCGNNPYYQWGRKDPFVGVISATLNVVDGAVSTIGTLKTSYIATDWSKTDNPSALSGDYGNNDMTVDEKNINRKTTIEAIDAGDLIKYPYKWHNPKCIAYSFNGNPWASVNELYSNLWGDIGENETVKTVYDPCPVGYKVPNYYIFTGFTVQGLNRTNAKNWYYDAIADNILDAYKNTFEFYTNISKSQSIIFPKSGYRDWDANSTSFKYGIETSYGEGMGVGYVWTARQDGYYTPEGTLYKFDWVNHFDFSHKDPYDNSHYVRPQNKFFGCDGFPIRPVSETRPSPLENN